MKEPSPDAGEPHRPIQRLAHPAVTLAGHVLYTLLTSLLLANTAWLMPLLVRLHFGSPDPYWRDWQTTLITAAVPIFMVLSIFWNDLLHRLRLGRYLLVFWLVAVFPLGCVALAHNYWQLLACHVIATAGLGGQSPLNGKLLKHFYSDAVRGRVYALLNVVMLATAVAAVYVVGAWMERDPDAFRVYFPCAALVQLGGVGILLGLARLTGITHEPQAELRASWAALARPVLHMGATLRADRTFLRFERAFMTYGAAYMLCDALLPVLATAQLGLRYEDYAHSTQVVTKLVMLATMLPIGWLHDRIGPVRTSGLAFTVLALYPVLLGTAGGAFGVALASIPYGLGMAGVQMGWMLGPVRLAGTAEQVPQYVAIHATLVGIRGLVFQGLGMLLYKLTGSFIPPLALATVAFIWAAAQMRQLQGALSQSAMPPVAAPPITGAAEAAGGRP
jgi:MFS family permease